MSTPSEPEPEPGVISTARLPGGRRCVLRDGHDGECSRRLRR
ncbi:hypothetical protein ABZ807_32075 [Micromonospora sp. NPDC047548]